MRISQLGLFFVFVLPLWLLGGEMEEIVAMTLANDPKKRSHELFVKAAKIRTKATREQLYYPVIDLQGEYGRDKYHYNTNETKITYNSTFSSYTLSLRQNLYNPQLFALIEQNGIKERYMQLQKESYEHNLAAQVVGLYIDLLYFSQLHILYTEKVKSLENIYKEIEKRYDLRLATTVDLSQAKAEWYRARSELRQVEHQRINLMQKLQLFTGKKIEPKGWVRETIKKGIRLPSRLSSNFEYRLALLNTQIAKKEVLKREKALYPTLAFTASYGDTDNSDSITRRDNSRVYVELKTPVFNKSSYSSIKEAKVLYLSAVSDMHAVARELNRTKSDLLFSIESIRALLESDESLIRAKEEYLRQIRRSFVHRLVSIAQLGKALVELYDVRAGKIGHQRELLGRYLDYYLLSGNLLYCGVKNLEAYIYEGGDYGNGSH